MNKDFLNIKNPKQYLSIALLILYELHIHDEVKKNKSKNILNVIDVKNIIL